MKDDAGAPGACEALGAGRIAVLPPYRADLNAIARDYITAKGHQVPVFGHHVLMATSSNGNAKHDVWNDPVWNVVRPLDTSIVLNLRREIKSV